MQINRTGQTYPAPGGGPLPRCRKVEVTDGWTPAARRTCRALPVPKRTDELVYRFDFVGEVGEPKTFGKRQNQTGQQEIAMVGRTRHV